MSNKGSTKSVDVVIVAVTAFLAGALAVFGGLTVFNRYIGSCTGPESYVIVILLIACFWNFAVAVTFSERLIRFIKTTKHN